MWKSCKLNAMLIIYISWIWNQSITIHAVTNDDHHPSLPSHFYTPDLNASPPPSDEDKPASKNASQFQKEQNPVSKSKDAMLKVSHLTPKQEEKRKRERERAARNWRNLSIEERKRRASIKNAKQAQKYRDLPEDLKEIKRAKMRVQTSKRRKKDPAKFAAYQRRYRKNNPEKARIWQRNRTEKEKALGLKVDKETSKVKDS